MKQREVEVSEAEYLRYLIDGCSGGDNPCTLISSP